MAFILQYHNVLLKNIYLGLVNVLEIEFGYCILAELQSVKGPMGLPIERDLHFESKSLRELMEWHNKQSEK